MEGKQSQIHWIIHFDIFSLNSRNNSSTSNFAEKDFVSMYNKVNTKPMYKYKTDAYNSDVYI